MSEKGSVDCYRYGFQGQEKDDEIKGAGNSYDFGARMYDSRLGRWLTRDPLAKKYTSESPYNFVKNSPIGAIDPNGKDVYLIIWKSKDGETGHAAIAVDNYKKVETKIIENGKEVTKTEWVKDGTVTYYDLWPKNQVGKTELQSDVIADYNKKYNVKKADLLDTDPSISGEKGNVSEFGEGRPPDGVVQIGTSGVTEDYKIKLKLKGIQDAGEDYNACSNNCSTFAQEGLKAIDPSVDASQEVKPTGALSLLYEDATVVAPNNLFNEATEMKGAKVIKGPAKMEARPYLEYFGK